jgi:hypothetical protein
MIRYYKEFTCTGCGSWYVPISRKHHNTNTVHNFCSKLCYRNYKNTVVEKSCEHCGIVVYIRQKILNRRKSGKVFCDNSCAAKHNNSIRVRKTTNTVAERVVRYTDTELKKCCRAIFKL